MFFLGPWPKFTKQVFNKLIPTYAKIKHVEYSPGGAL